MTDAREWYVIDWDNLTLGDRALDYSILLWPLVRDGSAHWSDFGVPVGDPGFSERMEFYERVNLLDEVIDSLADYVEADVSPEHAESVRETKRALHLESLDLYLGKYSALA